MPDPHKLLDDILAAQKGFKDKEGNWLEFAQAPPAYKTLVAAAEHLFHEDRYREAAAQLLQAKLMQRRANIEYFLALAHRSYPRDQHVQGLLNRAGVAFNQGYLDQCIRILGEAPLYFAE